MITIVYGVPGSGKTYYSVWWIKKRVLEEGDIFFRVRSDRLLITNLRLLLDSDEGYIYVEDVHVLAKYMDVDFWKANLQYAQGKKVVFVIDECQRFFHFYGNDVKVLYFLQYHRHLGVDILLITQTPKSIPQKVFELCEYVIEAVPKSVNPFSWKYFRYRVLHPLDRSEVLRRFHLPFDPAVFYLYRDMIYGEEGEERVGNAYLRYYVMFIGLVVLLVGLIYFFFSNFFSPVSVHSKSQPVGSVSSPAVSSPALVRSSVTYEDLIVEEGKSTEGGYSPERSSLVEPEPLPKPSEEPKGCGYVVIEVARPSARRSDSSGLELSSGPKVVELP
jgi:zona occludens toxin (predicted ATPase)